MALWSEDDCATTIYDGLGPDDEPVDGWDVFLDRVLLVAATILVVLVTVAGIVQITRWVA